MKEIKYYKYYVRNDDNHIVACVGIGVDKNVPEGSRYKYYRLISFPNPKEKFDKKSFSKYNYDTLMEMINNGSKDVKFTIYGGLADTIDNFRFYWTVKYGEFKNDDYNYKFKNNVILYNHEYRMITPPLDVVTRSSNT